MKTNKTAVITGAAGMLGTALIRLMSENNYRIYAVMRPDSPRNALVPVGENIFPIECELDEIDTLSEKITEKCNLFFHFGWAGTFGNVRNDMERQVKNISACVKAAETAHKLGCRTFIGSGSQAEYGRCDRPLTAATPPFPENGYGMAKLCAGQMVGKICENNGMICLWFRILSVYGINDGENTLISSAMRKMLKGERVSCTSGEQIWDYLYCDDAANAMLSAAEKCSRSAVYPLGSGKPRKLREYITEMKEVLDSSSEIGFGDVPYGDKQVMYLCADISKLTADYGFVPQINFADGIRNLQNSLTM